MSLLEFGLLTAIGFMGGGMFLGWRGAICGALIPLIIDVSNKIRSFLQERIKDEERREER